MSIEDKLILIHHICIRLPYGVHVDLEGMQGLVHNIEVWPKFDENDNVYDCGCYIDFFMDNHPIEVSNFKLVLDKEDDDFEYLNNKNLVVKPL